MNNIPSPEEQRKLIDKIEKESISIGEQVCPISTVWYRSWKNYVESENPDLTSSDVGPIDNSQIITDGRVNPNSLEYFNFYLIHKESYDLLQKWFSGGPTLALNVISDSRGRAVVATRYTTVKIIYDNIEKEIQIHKYMKISEVHDEAKKLFNIPDTQKSRLIDFYGKILGTEMDDQKYIENYQIVNNEDILLDTYDEEKEEWYSATLNNTEANESSDSSMSSLSEDESTSKGSSNDNDNNAGTVGFSNLGNTCFFNSGTQCLMHTYPFISKFLLDNHWEEELNYENKIGMKGELAKAFASLAKKVWSGAYSSFSPSNLKYVIGRFRDIFSGYDQQDSHELVFAMLDGIHEDLNRVKKRETVESIEGDGLDDEKIAKESWNRYKKINDSIVVDIFDGLVRSRLICPECKSTTIVFDPYRSIAMPIAKPHTQKIKVLFVPYDFFEKKQQFKIEIPSSKKGINQIVSSEISKLIGRKVNVRIATRAFSSSPMKWSTKELGENTTAYAYEIPENENALYMTVSIEIKPKYTVCSSSANKLSEIVGIPFLVDVSDLPDDFDDDDKINLFEKKIEERIDKLWPNEGEKIKDEENNKETNEEENNKEDNEENNKKDNEDVNEEENKKDNTEEEEANELVKKFKKKMELECDDTFSNSSQKIHIKFKSSQTTYYYYQAPPKEPIKTAFKNIPSITKSRAIIHLNSKSNYSIPNLLESIQDLTIKKDKKKTDDITLDKCFSYFSMAEVLDENNQWYCPKCKKFVCAEKKLDIWQVPQILIIQLKRFSGSGYWAKKLDHYIDFPEILDMKKYIIGPQKNEDEIKYRLYAVSNQYGSLGGGHYTAEARVRNPITKTDKGWHNFDDSYVSKSSEEKAHTSAAYVLFYERIK